MTITPAPKTTRTEPATVAHGSNLKRLGQLAVDLLKGTLWKERTDMQKLVGQVFCRLFKKDKAADDFTQDPEFVAALTLAKREFDQFVSTQESINLQKALLESARDCQKVVKRVGCQNSSNACFAISCLQALHHMPKLRESLTEKLESAELKEKLLTLVDMLDAGVELTDAEVNTLRRGAIEKGFHAVSDSSQEDALEFLQFILEAVGYPSYRHQIAAHHNLEVEVPSIVLQGGNSNIIPLSLGDAREGTEVSAILSHNIVDEQVDVDSLYTSDRLHLDEELLLKLSRFKKPIEIHPTLQGVRLYEKEIPSTLILALKRYSYEDETPKKISTSYVPSMHLSVLVNTEDKKTFRQNYQLRSLVIHEGESTRHGHYYTYVVENEKDTLIEFNDDRVVETKMPDIAGVKNPLTMHKDIGKNVYLLFYQKM